jgi:uncharacterized protein YbjQ (UPF0145 family)
METVMLNLNKDKAPLYFSTLQAPPPGYRIVECFGIASAMSSYNPNSLATFLKDPNKVAMSVTESLRKTTPREANAVLGITFQQVQATVNKAEVIMTTAMGTAAKIEPCNDAQVQNSSLANQNTAAPSQPENTNVSEAVPSEGNEGEGSEGKHPSSMQQPPIY